MLASVLQSPNCWALTDATAHGAASAEEGSVQPEMASLPHDAGGRCLTKVIQAGRVSALECGDRGALFAEHGEEGGEGRTSSESSRTG